MTVLEGGKDTKPIEEIPSQVCATAGGMVRHSVTNTERVRSGCTSAAATIFCRPTGQPHEPARRMAGHRSASEAPAEKINLRLYQVNAIDQIDGAIARGVRRIMVQLATGAGKTHIASAMTAERHSQNKPVIFTVPAIELVDQTLEKFHREGIRDVGVMQAQHRRTDTHSRSRLPPCRP